MIFRKTIILAVAVLAAAGLYYLNEVRWSKEREDAREEVKRIYKISPEDVREVTLIRAEDEVTLTVARRPDGWRLVAPIEESAEQQLCDQMAEAVADLQREMVISQEPGDLAEFGLDEPSIVLTFILASGESHTVLIGDKTPTNVAYYAKLPDDPAVFAVETYDHNRLNRTLYDLRDKTIVSIPIEEVREVVYEHGPLKMSIEPLGNDDWMIREPVEARASTAKVRNFIQSFNYARAQEFVSESAEELTPYGLDDPQYRVSAYLEGETEPKVVLLGNLDAAEEMIYLKLANSSRVLTIRKDILEKFPRTAADFRERQLFGPDPAVITKIALARADQEMVLEKDAEGQWFITAPISTKADYESANMLALDLTNLRVDAFLEDNPEDLEVYGLAEPRLTIRAWQEGEDGPRVFVLGDHDDAGVAVYAKLESEPSVYRLEAEPARRVERSLYDLRDKHLYAFREEDIDELAVSYPDRSFAFKRRANNWLIQEPEKARAIRWRVNNLLWEIASVQFMKIAAEDVSASEMAKYGFESPQVRISLRTKEGESLDELLIGNAAPDEDALYAKLAGEERLYLVGAYFLEKLPKDVADFKAR